MTSIAIFAKAPLAGYAKTRLIPALGAVGAARLHREMTLHTLRVASEVAHDDLTLWCAPDANQRFFRALMKSNATTRGLNFRRQIEGDLGARMTAAFAETQSAMLLIGTDCPMLRPSHLRQAAAALAAGHDAVFIPAEDGGYVLVGLARPQPEIFRDITWGSPQVMAQTRERLAKQNLQWHELETLWDVDEAEDLSRWREMQIAEAASPVAFPPVPLAGESLGEVRS